MNASLNFKEDIVMTKEEAKGFVDSARQAYMERAMVHCKYYGVSVVPVCNMVFKPLEDGKVSVSFQDGYSLSPTDGVFEGLDLNLGGLVMDGTCHKLGENNYEFRGKRGQRFRRRLNQGMAAMAYGIVGSKMGKGRGRSNA